jgi:hypothetical protein
MQYELRNKEDIIKMKEQMESVKSYIKDPCVRSQFDSFISALRWVLKQKNTF